MRVKPKAHHVKQLILAPVPIRNRAAIQASVRPGFARSPHTLRPAFTTVISADLMRSPRATAPLFSSR